MQTLISSKPSRISSLVNANPLMPEVRTVWRTITASNQPQRRLRPVTVPNSRPRSPSRSPSALSCSVGNGPEPPRAGYALVIPSTYPTAPGPMPQPVEAVPDTVLDEVTYGYVP